MWYVDPRLIPSIRKLNTFLVSSIPNFQFYCSRHWWLSVCLFLSVFDPEARRGGLQYHPWSDQFQAYFKVPPNAWDCKSSYCFLVLLSLPFLQQTLEVIVGEHHYLKQIISACGVFLILICPICSHQCHYLHWFLWTQ